eukprot:XP_001705961.1 Hypothetical protein GL50803_115734 [Giardia lamblia ATCC 50803]
MPKASTNYSLAPTADPCTTCRETENSKISSNAVPRACCSSTLWPIRGRPG